MVLVANYVRTIQRVWVSIDISVNQKPSKCPCFAYFTFDFRCLYDAHSALTTIADHGERFDQTASLFIDAG
jgi:hypothetical protein